MIISAATANNTEIFELRVFTNNESHGWLYSKGETTALTVWGIVGESKTAEGQSQLQMLSIMFREKVWKRNPMHISVEWECAMISSAPE